MPPGVTTVTFTLPLPGGLTATRLVSLRTEIELACVEPKPTSSAPVKPVPVIATSVPPAAGPVTGETDVTVGVATFGLLLCECRDDQREHRRNDLPGVRATAAAAVRTAGLVAAVARSSILAPTLAATTTTAG